MTAVPPPGVLVALGLRWRPLAATAAGRVYDLPADGVESALLSEGRRGARYDTILSFMRTPQVSDLDSFVASLERILADDGWILMIEPAGSGRSRPRGWRRSRLGRSEAQRRRGCPERDVVSALRSGGFTVTDLNRRELESAPAQWRRYLEIRARRQTPTITRPGG